MEREGGKGEREKERLQNALNSVSWTIRRQWVANWALSGIIIRVREMPWQVPLPGN